MLPIDNIPQQGMYCLTNRRRDRNYVIYDHRGGITYQHYWYFQRSKQGPSF